MINGRDTICTITVLTPDENEITVMDLRQELNLFLTSVGARVLQSPLDDIQDSTVINTTFEIHERMRETVENFYHLTAMYPKLYEATITFNKIEPLDEPAVGVIIT